MFNKKGLLYFKGYEPRFKKTGCLVDQLSHTPEEAGQSYKISHGRRIVCESIEHDLTEVEDTEGDDGQAWDGGNHRDKVELK